MKKSVSLILTALLSISLISGCTQQKEAAAPEVSETPINVAVMKGPTGMGMVSLMNQSEEGASLNPYNFRISGTADEIVADIVRESLTSQLFRQISHRCCITRPRERYLQRR